MLIIERVDVKHYSFTGSKRQEEILKDCLKVYIEGAHFSPKYKEGKWDGYHRFYDTRNRFEIGLLDEVLLHLESRKISFRVREKEFREKIITDYSLDERLRPHQMEGVDSFFGTNYGLMVIPTRGGKTFVSGEIIKHVLDCYEESSTLFYVDTIDLFSQTVGEISKYLNVPEKSIGTIDSNGVNIKQVTVAMVQTVTSIFNNKKPEAKVLEAYFRKLTFLIVDEVQEYSGENRMKLIKKCKNVHFLLGLSATPFKQIGNVVQNITLKGYFGGIVYEVEKSRLQDDGYLALDKAIVISHSCEQDKKYMPIVEGREKYDTYRDHLIRNSDGRNEILRSLISICEKNKWKTLVLFNSKEHGHKIAEMTGKIFICGDDNSKRREEAKENFLRGRGKVLMASNIFKKGTTLPEAEILIIGDGGLEGTNLEQKIGRVLGAVECKTKAVILDILDIEEEYFSEHSFNRLEVYSKAMGDDRIECYDEEDMMEIEESIKSWFDEK